MPASWRRSVSAVRDTVRRLSGKPDQWQTLRAYLDTLIPADESPSATQLGVTEQMLSRMEANPRSRQFITQGCAWLDAQAKQYGAAHFAALSDAQREQVVSLAATGKAGVLGKCFLIARRPTPSRPTMPILTVGVPLDTPALHNLGDSWTTRNPRPGVPHSRGRR